MMMTVTMAAKAKRRMRRIDGIFGDGSCLVDQLVKTWPREGSRQSCPNRRGGVFRLQSPRQGRWKWMPLDRRDHCTMSLGVF